MMLGKLSVALLLIAAPALAQEAPPADPPAEGEAASLPKSRPFKMKKVCRPQEVVGSSIPKMICVNKRIYLKEGEQPEPQKDAPEGETQG